MLNIKLYEPKEIKNWKQLVDFEEELRKGKGAWIFRGHGRTCADKIDFISSLEKAAKDFEADKIFKLSEIEMKLMREFSRRIHHYTSYVPEQEENVELLSLMRHHGAPTRLLDCTYSLFVAAFFALERENEKYEVWALNTNHFGYDKVFDKKLIGNGQEEIKNNKTEELFESKELQKIIVNHLFKNPQKLVYPVNPFRLNERLTIQQGLFLFPGDIDAGFEANLNIPEYLSKPQDNLIRIKIANNARIDIIKKLYRFNIHRAVLFPGLDGFADSLWTCLAHPESLG